MLKISVSSRNFYETERIQFRWKVNEIDEKFWFRRKVGISAQGNSKKKYFYERLKGYNFAEKSMKSMKNFDFAEKLEFQHKATQKKVYSIEISTTLCTDRNFHFSSEFQYDTWIGCILYTNTWILSTQKLSQNIAKTCFKK